MSMWNDFCDTVSKTTRKTADKTKSMANLASLKVKLNNLEASVSEEYDTLGRIYYLQEVGKVDNSEAIRTQIKFISDINKQINAVHAEIRELRKIEAEEKAAKEAEKEAKKAAKEAEKAAKEAAKAAEEAAEAAEEAEEAAEEAEEAAKEAAEDAEEKAE